MGHLIPLSGTHGCGKSTLVKMLKEKNWAVDEFQVSRYVQKEIFNVNSLSEVLTNPYSVMAFQEMILREKYDHDKRLNKSISNSKVSSRAIQQGIILTERSFADIAAYAALWLTRFGKHDIYTRWLKNYLMSCARYQFELYAANIYVSPIDHWEEDPNRAFKEDRDFVNGVIFDFFNTNRILTLNVPAGTPEERLKVLEMQIAIFIGDTI